MDNNTGGAVEAVVKQPVPPVIEFNRATGDMKVTFDDWYTLTGSVDPGYDYNISWDYTTKNVSVARTGCYKQNEVKVTATRYMGTEWNDLSQSSWAGIWAIWAGAYGCAAGPLWCVVWAAVSALAWAGLGTMDRSTDFLLETTSGTFKCQDNRCETLTGNGGYRTDGNTVWSTICY